jgi:hypothetical protein
MLVVLFRSGLTITVLPLEELNQGFLECFLKNCPIKPTSRGKKPKV